MTRTSYRFAILLLAVACSVVSATAHRKLWVTAYYAGWMQGNSNNGHLTAENIDYSALTHLIHFGLIVRPDGTFDTAGNGITSGNVRALVRRAHAAGRKVLIAVGGRESAQNFLQATRPERLNTFVNNLVTFMARRGYDGIDIDWEVLRDEDADQFAAFIERLRRVLDRIHPRPLLTAAAGSSPSTYARLADRFDQINLMTYDMSGPWSGWPAWHNSPIYDGGLTFPSTGKPLPSIDAVVTDFLDAGVPAGKLGIGIDYYGYVWQHPAAGGGPKKGSGLQPGRMVEATPTVQPNIPYFEIVQKFGAGTTAAWDSLAQAAYLSVDHDGKQVFVSYDDERSCRMKISYAREKRLGGVMIWELGGGYLPSAFTVRDRLLQAVKLAVQ